MIMRKLSQAGLAVALFLVSSSHARAEHFDFDPGLGNDLQQPNTALGDGTPYSWYYQGITLNYGGGFVDGREDATYHDSPYGNIPYFVFDGTAKSTAGHCLQLAFVAADSTAPNTNPVDSFRMSSSAKNGNEVVVMAGPSVSAPYTIVRMWVKNTGSGLYWHFKLADLDGANGAWNQSAMMNIWRLELNQADCTTNAVSKDSSLIWTTLIGTTANYKICVQTGSNQSNGIAPVCVDGG